MPPLMLWLPRPPPMPPLAYIAPSPDSAAARPPSRLLAPLGEPMPKAQRLTGRQADRQAGRQAGRQATDYGTAMNDGCGGNRKQLRTEDATMCESEHDFFRKPF